MEERSRDEARYMRHHYVSTNAVSLNRIEATSYINAARGTSDTQGIGVVCLGICNLLLANSFSLDAESP